MEDDNDTPMTKIRIHLRTQGSETDSSSEEHHNDGSTDPKDTQNLEEHVLDELNTKAIEVNSADEVRQAIKAVLSGKAPQVQSDGTDPVPLATLVPTATSEEIQVSLSHVYTPESGDQLLVPKHDKTRKRRGRPQKAGPSKRMKKGTIIEDFYVGKLSNLIRFPSYKRKSHQTESDSDDSIYTRLKGRKKR